LIKQKIQQQASNEFQEMMKKRLENSPAAKLKELIESLNLTEEQKTEIRKIDLNFQKELLGLRNDVEINQLEIKILFLETTEIRKIDLNFQKELLGLRNDVEINQLEIKILFLETEPNLVKIRAKLEEIADLQTELKMKGIEEYLAVKGILTSEQQEKLPEGIPFQKSI
jgi:hypothetical protein